MAPPLVSMPVGTARAVPRQPQRGSTRQRQVCQSVGALPVTVEEAAASSGYAAMSTSTYVTPSARAALFSPAQEQHEVEARICGKLPEWLQGDVVVNGGGDHSAMQHLFDGFAMVCKVHMEGGRAWGSQRFLDTKAYSAFKRTGKLAYREFVTPIPTNGWLEYVTKAMEPAYNILRQKPFATDNASVNVLPAGGPPGTLFAVSETLQAAYLVDGNTLATLKQVDYDDGVKGLITTAHPCVLPDGTLLNFTRSLPLGGFHLFRQDPVTLRRQEIAFIPDRHPLAPAWVHDFAASEHYAIIVEHPVYMSLPSLSFPGMVQCDFDPLDWRPEDGCRVHVVRLDGSEPARMYRAPTFFCFHYGNAFETKGPDGQVLLHLDMAAYKDINIMSDLSMPNLRNPQPGAEISPAWYERLSIPLSQEPGTMLQAPQQLVRNTIATGDYAEFPAINNAYSGKPYRYAYTLSAVRPTHMGNALSKLDLATGEAKTWYQPGTAPGEPKFIARPGGTAEDDGVVVTTLAGPGATSSLLVLDAASWTEIARAELPYAIPYMFHGTFVPNNAT